MGDDLDILFVAIGGTALVTGIAMLVRAIGERPGTSPKATAMLIAGMMATAFGLLMAGFAIAFAAGEPVDLNAEMAG